MAGSAFERRAFIPQSLRLVRIWLLSLFTLGDCCEEDEEEEEEEQEEKDAFL
jgi:hypothetical protein